MHYLMAAFGGALGSLARFSVGKLILKGNKSRCPVNTLLVNISGAVLLGVISGLHVDGNQYVFAAKGFLGAYTTFSTFMWEGVNLFETGRKYVLIYVTGTILLGIAGFAAGTTAGMFLAG